MNNKISFCEAICWPASHCEVLLYVSSKGAEFLKKIPNKTSLGASVKTFPLEDGNNYGVKSFFYLIELRYERCINDLIDDVNIFSNLLFCDEIFAIFGMFDGCFSFEKILDVEFDSSVFFIKYKNVSFFAFDDDFRCSCNWKIVMDNFRVYMKESGIIYQ